jgi:hypothetical protein
MSISRQLWNLGVRKTKSFETKPPFVFASPLRVGAVH